ncbi:MAG: FHA domain-containing protein [Anaerolineales bacterium]
MAELILALRFALAFILYAFLALILYILWRDLRAGGKVEGAVPHPAALKGEKGSAAGERILLRPVTALGRADDNTLVLDDPFASAHHAIVFWRENHWWLEDLGSHNGTLLNGEQVKGAARLAPEDRIRIGETILRFEPEA